MNTTLTSWYSFTDEGSTTFRCAACLTCVDLEFPQVDHHPRLCPQCGVGCAILNWKGRVLQIVPGNAPPGIQKILMFVQQEFDELEYAELLGALQTLMDDLYSAGLTRRCT